MHRGHQLVVAGAAGLLLGAALPWAKITSIFGTMTKAGYEGDGVITGGIGIILLIMVFLRPVRPGKRFIGGAILAGLAAAASIYDFVDVAQSISESEFGVAASVGSGLYLSVVAALIALFGSLQVAPVITSAPTWTPGEEAQPPS